MFSPHETAYIWWAAKSWFPFNTNASLPPPLPSVCFPPSIPFFLSVSMFLLMLTLPCPVRVMWSTLKKRQASCTPPLGCAPFFFVLSQFLLQHSILPYEERFFLLDNTQILSVPVIEYLRVGRSTAPGLFSLLLRSLFLFSVSFLY